MDIIYQQATSRNMYLPMAWTMGGRDIADEEADVVWGFVPVLGFMLYIISNFFVGGGYLYRLVPMPIIYLSANLLCSASKRHQQYIQIAKLKSSSLLRHTILLQNYILLLYYHRMRFGWILGIVGCWSERDMDMRRTAGLAPIAPCCPTMHADIFWDKPKNMLDN